MNNIVIQENNNELSTLTYIPNYFPPEKAKEIRSMLDNINSWQGGIRKDGLEVDRKQLWYQMEKNTFCKEWKKVHSRWESNIYTPQLLSLQESINNDCSKYLLSHKSIQIPNINSILINYYENGSKFIPPHQDNKLSFGNTPTIYLFSFGETREFYLERTLENSLVRNEEEKDLNKIFNLEDNSLFIMAGAVQKYFCHSILKSDTLNKRYSLTFREYLG